MSRICRTKSRYLCILFFSLQNVLIPQYCKVYKGPFITALVRTIDFQALVTQDGRIPHKHHLLILRLLTMDNAGTFFGSFCHLSCRRPTVFIIEFLLNIHILNFYFLFTNFCKIVYSAMPCFIIRFTILHFFKFYFTDFHIVVICKYLSSIYF